MCRSVLLLALVTLGACAGVRSHPSFEAGSIYAYDDATASRVHAAFERLAPEVRSMLRSDRPEPEVWVVPHERVGRNSGQTSDRRITLARGALDHLDATLAHELVHWYSAGAPRFPTVVAEGLAFWVSQRLTEGGTAPNALLVEEWDRTLRVSDAQFAAWTDPQAVLEFYWSGYWLVESIGLDRILELRHRAAAAGKGEVPAEWFRDALASR